MRRRTRTRWTRSRRRSTAIIASRIDRLEAGARGVERAAVSAASSGTAPCSTSANPLDVPAVGRHLAELARKGLIEPALRCSRARTAFASTTCSSGTSPMSRCPSSSGPTCTSGWRSGSTRRRPSRTSSSATTSSTRTAARIAARPADSRAGRLANAAGDRLAAAGLRSARRGDIAGRDEPARQRGGAPARRGDRSPRPPRRVGLASGERRPRTGRGGDRRGGRRRRGRPGPARRAARPDRAGEPPPQPRSRGRRRRDPRARDEGDPGPRGARRRPRARPHLVRDRDRPRHAPLPVRGGGGRRAKALDHYRSSGWPPAPCLQELAAAQFYGPARGRGRAPQVLGSCSRSPRPTWAARRTCRSSSPGWRRCEGTSRRPGAAPPGRGRCTTSSAGRRR